MKCHKLGGLNNRNLSLSVLEAGKSKIKVPGNSVPWLGLSPWLVDITLTLCPHWTREREETSSLVSVLIRALIPS